MKKISILSILFAIVISGCSVAQKARRDERERVVQSKGVFCDFVSESDFKDIDIELNLRLAKKCDATKPFTISSHKRVSENPGILYCCNTNPNAVFEQEGTAIKSEASAEAAKSTPAAPSATGFKSPPSK